MRNGTLEKSIVYILPGNLLLVGMDHVTEVCRRTGAWSLLNFKALHRMLNFVIAMLIFIHAAVRYNKGCL